MLAALALVVALQDAPAPVAAATERSGLTHLVAPDAHLLVEIESPAELHAALAGNSWMDLMLGPEGIAVDLMSVEPFASLVEPFLGADTDPRALARLVMSADPLSGDRDGVPIEALVLHEAVRELREPVLCYGHGGALSRGGTPSTFVVVTHVPSGSRELVERVAVVLGHEFDWTRAGAFDVAPLELGPGGAATSFLACREDLLVLVEADGAGAAQRELIRLARRYRERTDESHGYLPETLAAARAELDGPAHVRLALSFSDALEWVIEESATDPSLPDGLMEELALDEVRWLGARMHIGEGEAMDLELRATVPKRGVLAALAGTLGWSMPAALARRIPTDAIGVRLMGMDLARAADVVGSFVEDFVPPEAMGPFAALSETKEFAGFDVLQLVVEEFTGQVVSYTSGDEARRRASLERLTLTEESDPAGENGGVGGTTAFELRNGERVSKALRRLLWSIEQQSGEKVPLDEIEVDGRTLFGFEGLPGLWTWFGIADTALVVGTQIETVAEDLARSSDASAARVAELLEPLGARATNAFNLTVESNRTLVEIAEALRWGLDREDPHEFDPATERREGFVGHTFGTLSIVDGRFVFRSTSR
jgi:hypothetical protein